MIPDRLRSGEDLARDLLNRWGELCRDANVAEASDLKFDMLDEVTRECLIKAVRELVTFPIFDHEIDAISSRPTPPMFEEREAAPPPIPSGAPELHDCYVCGKPNSTITSGRPCYSCARNP